MMRIFSESSRRIGKSAMIEEMFSRHGKGALMVRADGSTLKHMGEAERVLPLQLTDGGKRK